MKQLSPDAGFVRFARRLLIVLLVMVLSGAERWLAVTSTELHFVFDGILVVAAVVCLHTSVRAGPILRSAWPYLAVVVLYVVWGLFVSPVPGIVTNAGLTVALLSVLVVLSASACVDTRSTLVIFANAVQVMAVCAVVYMLYEIYDPTLIRSIAVSLNPNATAFNFTRPAALWSNPDIAGPVLLLSFVLSLFATGWRAWVGRAAAGIGILLTTSRGAVYPFVGVLTVLVTVGLWQRVRVSRVAGGPSGSLAVVLSLAAAGVLAYVAVNIVSPNTVHGFTFADMAKLLDPTEATSSAFYPSRSSLAAFWLNAALSGPWQGSGLLSFHDVAGTAGAHNTYIMLLGEAGPIVLLAYVAALVWILGVILRRTSGNDRVAMLLLWATYVFAGLVSHNQIDSIVAIVGAALLFRLPFVLQDYSSEPVRSRSPRTVAQAT